MDVCLSVCLSLSPLICSFLKKSINKQFFKSRKNQTKGQSLNTLNFMTNRLHVPYFIISLWTGTALLCIHSTSLDHSMGTEPCATSLQWCLHGKHQQPPGYQIRLPHPASISSSGETTTSSSREETESYQKQQCRSVSKQPALSENHSTVPGYKDKLLLLLQ